MKCVIFLFIFSWLYSAKTVAQTNLQIVDSLFGSCKVDFPLTYRKKDKEKYTASAKEMKNEELILLSYSSKVGNVTYSRVKIFVKSDGKEDRIAIYSVKNSSRYFFPVFDEKHDRYFRAACFDEILSAHPNLKNFYEVDFGSQFKSE